jgi:hypothetical protein
MKLYKIRLLTFLLLLCIFGMVALFAGCTSTKNLEKQKEEVRIKQTRELIDSLDFYKKEVLRIESELRESEYNTVTFDSTKCPEVHIPDCPGMANNDTVQKLILDLNSAINKMNLMENKIKTYADGSVEASGRIKMFKRENEKLSRFTIEQQKIIDSLRSIKQKDVAVVETVKEEKKLDKKTSWGLWWLWLLIGFSIHDALSMKKGFVYSLFKLFTKK